MLCSDLLRNVASERFGETYVRIVTNMSWKAGMWDRAWCMYILWVFVMRIPLFNYTYTCVWRMFVRLWY